MTKQNYKLVSFIVFIGFVATLLFIVLMALYPDGGQFHNYADRSEKAAVLTAAQAQVNIYYIIVDNFFIVGYSGIFYGLYRLIQKDDAYWSKFALTFGLITVGLDFIENGFVVMLNNGIVSGFSPDPLVWNFFWLVSALKDIAAYISVFTFVLLLLYTLQSDPAVRSTKLVFIVLLGLFAFIGSLGLFSPLFLKLRGLLFVIDLAIASFLFYRMPSRSIT